MKRVRGTSAARRYWWMRVRARKLQKLPGLLMHLRKDHPISLVFIEANDDALLRRYSETRRPHPLGKDYSVREKLALRTRADGADPQTRGSGHRLDAI